jgi:hypothetical protein
VLVYSTQEVFSITKVALTIPETFSALPLQEQELLLRAGLYEALHARIRQIESELDETTAQLAAYEKKYGVILAEFESQILADNDSLEVHDDYMDWYYWSRAQAEKQQLLSNLLRIELA